MFKDDAQSRKGGVDLEQVRKKSRFCIQDMNILWIDLALSQLLLKDQI